MHVALNPWGGLRCVREVTSSRMWQRMSKKNWARAQKPYKSGEKRLSPVAWCKRGKRLPAGTGEEPDSQFPGGYRVGGPDELL
jgi:hypothetical protein